MSSERKLSINNFIFEILDQKNVYLGTHEAKIDTLKGHRSLSIFDDGGWVPDSPIRDIVMLCWLQGFLGV